QRAARPRTADRVWRLSRASQGEMMTTRCCHGARCEGARSDGATCSGVRGERPSRRPAARIRAVLLTAALASVMSGFSRTVSAQDSDLDPRIVKLVGAVSEERLGVILKKLE